MDIYLYASDRETGRVQRPSHIVVPASRPPGRAVKLARLSAGDNPDPEPGGWSRLGAILRNHFAVDLTVANVKLEPGALYGFAIAHLTSATPLTLRDEQRAELKRFVAVGGTLVIDAAGGSAIFADAAERELAALYPDAKEGVVVPVDHELFAMSKGPPAGRIKTVSYDVSGLHDARVQEAGR